jgi:subtilisin-like proprotein convertase family protein
MKVSSPANRILRSWSPVAAIGSTWTPPPSSLTPQLATALRSDTDVAPLLADGAPGQRVAFSPFTPGDFDVGRDGFYDRPDTQRAMDFLDSIDVQTIGISNPGAGVLNWRISVSNPDDTSWLRIRKVDPDTGEETRFETLTGAVATESDLIEIFVDREGLAPGDYQGEITIESNGGPAAFPREPSRVIPVAMQVDGLGGDYQVRVDIDTVNGIPADLPNPRLFLSLYSDAPETAPDDGRMKGVIDASRTLLFPFDVRMTGSVYQQGTARFIVNGSFELPLDDPDDLEDGNNPYQTPLRRDITLIGDRRDHDNPADALLGPLDLKGEYRETIRGLLGEPIYLVGTFTALRVTELPTALDSARIACAGVGPDIPDQGFLEATLVAPEQLIITDVELTLDLSHSRATDLRVTLVSPYGEQVLLRDQQTGDLGGVTYEDTAVSLEPLSIFKGTLSRLPAQDGTSGSGEWHLKVEDLAAGETGRLNACELRLAGTQARRITGTVTQDQGGSPSPLANASVLITGCGVSTIATTNAQGIFSFDGLVDCLYQLTIHADGFERTSTEVALFGNDALDLGLTTSAAQTGSPIDLPVLSDGIYSLDRITALASAGALQPRARLRYVGDSATFDVDRPPFSSGPGDIGDEDTSEFSITVSTCTKTNRPNFDGPADPCLPIQVGDTRSPLLPDTTIDGPVGTGQHVRAFVYIGGPIIGESVSGNLRLSIGANP